MKNKKWKQSLLAFVCVFTMMSTGLSVTAAEAVEPEEASLMTARFTGKCGCIMGSMDYGTVSRRNCVAHDGNTHTTEYHITFICPNGHGRQSKTVYISETHVPSGSYRDDGHKKPKDGKGTDTGIHIYTHRCRECDDVLNQLDLTCMASKDAEYGHAVP